MPTTKPVKITRVIKRPQPERAYSLADVQAAYKRGFEDGYSEGYRDADPILTYAEAKSGEQHVR